MIDNPQWYVGTTWYADAHTRAMVSSADPIGDCIRAACDGDKIQMLPGAFPRAHGPFGGKSDIHICGWERSRGVSTILRDDAVGSSDTFILGDYDNHFVIESVNLECDDRAALKTTDTVGPQIALIDVYMYGKGSPHDPLWHDTSKWGVHAYNTKGYSETRCYKWGIFGEHGDYLHNIQGNHAFAEGGAGGLSGCDILVANRMNEGPVGKGDITIRDRWTEDVCVGQGGYALSFFGGMPSSNITVERWNLRLGCKAALAEPWSKNICGAISTRPSPESEAGKGDMAHPGGIAGLHLPYCDIEIGTIYHGRTGMIRQALEIEDVRLFTMVETRIKVTRAPGAYPIAMTIASNVDDVKFYGSNRVEGWIDWHPGAPDFGRYKTLESFRVAHPECFA